MYRSRGLTGQRKVSTGESIAVDQLDPMIRVRLSLTNRWRAIMIFFSPVTFPSSGRWRPLTPRSAVTRRSPLTVHDVTQNEEACMPQGPYVSTDSRSLSAGTKGSIHGNPVQHLLSVARRLTESSQVSSHVVVLLSFNLSVLQIAPNCTRPLCRTIRTSCSTGSNTDVQWSHKCRGIGDIRLPPVPSQDCLCPICGHQSCQPFR